MQTFMTMLCIWLGTKTYQRATTPKNTFPPHCEMFATSTSKRQIYISANFRLHICKLKIK